jgi:hypothetical protein
MGIYGGKDAKPNTRPTRIIGSRRSNAIVSEIYALTLSCKRMGGPFYGFGNERFFETPMPAPWKFARFERALLFCLAQKDFVVPVRIEWRVDVDQIDARLRQLARLFEIIAAINDAGVDQRRGFGGLRHARGS